MSDAKEIVKQPNPGATIEAALMARRDFLGKVLPQHMTPERLIKVALLARSRSPLLLQCSQESLIKAILQCAELGLEPSGSIGGAHLVPFRNKHTGKYEATLIPDYRGLVDLARRSGEIRTLEAHIIYKNERKKIAFGTKPVLEHEPLLEGDPGAPIAVYATAKLKGGARQTEVMTIAAVNKIRERSRASDSGPWVTDWEAMAKKTVVKQLVKFLPRSRELQRAVDIEDNFELGEIPFGDVELPAEVQPPELPSKTEQVKEKARRKVVVEDVVEPPPSETKKEEGAAT